MADLNRIYAACARSRDAFCIAATNADEEDPFTALLAYDGAFPQPWRRIDVPRIVSSITDHHMPDAAKAVYVALSSEGDVYKLNDPIETERIMGVGFSSNDSNKLGSVSCISEVGNTLYASGMDSQVYIHQKDGWDWLGATRILPETSYEYFSFSNISGSRHDDIYASGSAAPMNSSRPLSDADWDEFDRLMKQGDQEGALSVSRRAQGSGRTREGRAFHWNGTRWNKLAVPMREPFRDLYVESPTKIWLAGTGGLLLEGNAQDGFSQRHASIGENHIVSFTKFRDMHICATDYALHTFDGQKLKPLKPRFAIAAVPTPLKIQEADGFLFYFDYKQGVFRYDGATWEQIPIPARLLDRTFKRL